jgi:hypothetical protein
MVRKAQNLHKPNSSKVSRTGFEKMRMSNERTRKDILRIRADQAKRTESDKPLHQPQVHRR